MCLSNKLNAVSLARSHNSEWALCSIVCSKHYESFNKLKCSVLVQELAGKPNKMANTSLRSSCLLSVGQKQFIRGKYLSGLHFFGQNTSLRKVRAGSESETLEEWYLLSSFPGSCPANFSFYLLGQSTCQSVTLPSAGGDHSY